MSDQPTIPTDIKEAVAKDIETIRAKIVADYTFLAEFLPKEDVPTLDIPTLGTNMERIRYNPMFLFKRSFKDKMFMYMHEVAHAFLGHPLRIRPGFDMEVAQVAADYVTNDLLDDAGFELPHDAIIKYKYKGMSFEDVYNILIQQQNQQDKHNPSKHGAFEPSPKGQGDGKGDPHEKPSDDPHSNDQQETEQQHQQRLQEHEQKQLGAMQTAEMMGNVSLDLQRRFNKMKEKDVNWREALPTEIETIVGMEDYSYAVPNTNIDDEEFIYPGMIGTKNKPMGILVDTSGSISLKQLEEMVRDIVSIVEKSEPEKIYVLGIDYNLKSIQEFDGDDTDIQGKIELKGGGGTSFKPGIEYLNNIEDQVGMAIYLTDGYCSSYPAQPDYPIIWLVYGGNDRFSPPFGKVIKMS